MKFIIAYKYSEGRKTDVEEIEDVLGLEHWLSFISLTSLWAWKIECTDIKFPLLGNKVVLGGFNIGVLDTE